MILAGLEPKRQDGHQQHFKSDINASTIGGGGNKFKIHTHQGALYERKRPENLFEENEELKDGGDAKAHKCLTETSQTRHSGHFDMKSHSFLPLRDIEGMNENANQSPDGEVIPDVNDVDDGEVSNENEVQREKRRMEFKTYARRSQSLIAHYKQNRAKSWIIYPEHRFHKIWDTIITMYVLLVLS